jgi:hypothetical protein
MRSFNIGRSSFAVLAFCGALALLMSHAFAQNRGYFCADPRAVAPYLPPASECKTGWQKYPTAPPPDRQGSDPSSCPAWVIDRQGKSPLTPITCVTIYVNTPSPAARAIPGQAPREAFTIGNADAAVQNFIAQVNGLMDKYNAGWRPTSAEIAEHAQQGYAASTLSTKLHVPENALDTDKQAINNAFLDNAGHALQFIDTTTEDARTAAAERAGERAYYLVALSTLNDNGRLRRLPGFTPLAHIRAPQAREGCEKQAEIAGRQHLLGSANPYVSIQYECWTEAKYMAVAAALTRCNQYGVGCDQLPF